jgi:L-ascorbate metabolism protein UlaG (beta-lactamase superfamily)
MKIRHFLYNTFLIEDSETRVAIDPGLNLWIGKLKSLIPKSEWGDITHIFVTHGDPDHYWYVDRVARVSRAPVVCGKELVRQRGGDVFLLDPRSRGVRYTTESENVYAIDVGETLDVDGVRVEGLKARHGPVAIKFLSGLIRHAFTPGPGERVGMGAMGFRFTVGATTLVNLGDTLIQKEWEGLKPDILMIPIGGRRARNTMDEDEALAAIDLISPKLVIPCHYNCPFFWKRNANPADAEYFKTRVEDMGMECRIMGYGDELVF